MRMFSSKRQNRIYRQTSILVCPLPLKMLHFYENGDLRGPTDHLNYYNDEQWEEVYQQVPSVCLAKAVLERLLDKLRLLVQKYSDLLYNPYRTSNIPREYNAYWTEYSHWYVQERQTILRELHSGLETFIERGSGKVFFDGYSDGEINRLRKRSYKYMAYYIIKNQYNVLQTFKKDLGDRYNDNMIRRNLNPTARGARILMLNERTPTVTTNPL